ncbi:MAG: hypothetical protein IKX48_05845 [Victivallales bacterium]|nr:hypothetical protein [Victivallales bacterium]MBR5024568.1 hypothetical protein [Victivallales bacterium]
MCNIAGYTGNRQAAPILIDMMRHEEGYWGGYYTGIATVDNGRVYHAKVVGDVETLVRETDAMNLPGTTGIIHSRTPSGGDREWAYPFVSCDGKIAFVENGIIGSFEKTTDFPTLAMDLKQKGHKLSSCTTDEIKGYPRLSDGTSVHYSEVQCHLLEELMNSGLSPFEALREMLRRWPCEDVGVAIHRDYPDKIFAARFNQPMTLARANGEAFISTTPLAFPEQDFFGIDVLPANACYEISVNRLRILNVINQSVRISPITPTVFAKALQDVTVMLQAAKDPVPFSAVAETCKFPQGGIPQMALLGYLVLESLLKSGKVSQTTIRKDGMTADLTAPVFMMSWK